MRDAIDIYPELLPRNTLHAPFLPTVPVVRRPFREGRLMSSRELLAALAGGTPVSGAELATRLGLTRAAVWKQVQQLRDQGLPVEARRGAGYRLPWPVQLLDAGAIADRCRPRAGALEVHWSLDSTSSECQRRSGELPDASIVLAETQHAGRGRRGRSWLSPPGLNV